MGEIYRGYDIDKHPEEGYVIRKGGLVVCSQPSLEFAYKWVDQERKRQLTQSN